MRLWIIKVMVYLLGWKSHGLMEDVASWSVDKLANKNDSHFGPKLKMQVDLAIKARKG